MLLEIRFEKLKERLVDTQSEVVRGQAFELRELLKIFIDSPVKRH